MKKIISNTIQIALYPFTFLAALLLKLIARLSASGGASDKIFMTLGILPVPDHYYQPLINPKKYLKRPLSDIRNLPGLDLNIEQQLDLLKSFNFNDELLKIPEKKQDDNKYFHLNKFYELADAEYLYNLIRHFKPKRIIEIGSGFSTLMARNAIEENENENPDYSCKHICIEPFENKWLKSLNIELIKAKVESLDKGIFKELERNDVLFIDSSHVIRPQGDVLFEILELLPLLNSGVLIHFHDIYSPRDYPDYLLNKHILWNEQYLLEAFLSNNKEYEIIGALNYLSCNYKSQLSEKCPVYASYPEFVPGAFWIVKK